MAPPLAGFAVRRESGYAAKMETVPALIVEGLGCARGGQLLFERLDLRLEPGAALQVEGRNGAGKSSLLRILAGLLRPVAGRVINPFRIGWAGHELALKPSMRLRDELSHWARLDGRGPEAVAAALAAFDLAPLADLPVGVLSSGQKHRAGLARAHASGAELWLLDEPGVGLDGASLARLAAAMRAHRAAGGLVIAATHGDIGLDAPQKLILA
ncbi:MAG: heme ABC exporter ATP-binding protein CcmA [Polymorphobacter sp.]